MGIFEDFTVKYKANTLVMKKEIKQLQGRT